MLKCHIHGLQAFLIFALWLLPLGGHYLPPPNICILFTHTTCVLHPYMCKPPLWKT